MAKLAGNDATPTYAPGGLLFRKAGTEFADFTVATINAALAASGDDEFILIPGVEEFTAESSTGDEKTDSFRKTYVLFNNLEGSASSFRVNPEGYTELETLFSSGNVDILYITGSLTESNLTVAAADRVRYFYSQPVTLGEPSFGTDGIVTVGMTWKSEIAQGATKPSGWKTVVA